MIQNSLTRKQSNAVAAMLSMGSLEEVAAHVGVTRVTLQRWLREPEFSRCLREASAEIVRHSIGLLKGAAVRAVSALSRNLDCGTPAAEIRAAQVLLDRLQAALDREELLGQIEALKVRLHELTSGGQTGPGAGCGDLADPARVEPLRPLPGGPDRVCEGRPESPVVGEATGDSQAAPDPTVPSVGEGQP